MFRLRALGALSLVDSSGAAAITQRRRLALLAILALAGDRGITRDRVRALLWPESTDEQARHALDQLLYAIRRQLDERIFVGTDPLLLNRAVVSSDVAAFEEAVRAGAHADAVALYAGAFLDGFYIRDAAEFERWTADQRDRLAAMHVQALGRVASEASRAGQVTAELDARKRIVDGDRLSERALLAFVRALATAGDRAEAIRQAQAYEERVRSEIGEVGASALHALVQELLAANASQPAARGASAASPSTAKRASS